MSDFAQLLLPGDVGFGVLSTYGMGCPTGDALANLGSSASGAGTLVTANLAMFYPVIVPNRVTVSAFAWSNSTTVSGNVDAGIYDKLGNLLAHCGSTAQAGASGLQVAAALANATLAPDLYYLAIAADNTTATFARSSITAPFLRALGCVQMAAAFPLPSTATFAAATFAAVPLLAAQIMGVM